MSVAERGMGLALGALRRVAGLEVLDRWNLRERTERGVHALTRNGGRLLLGGPGQRVAGAANRVFAAVGPSRSAPARQATTRVPDLFDLTPTDEQRMLQEALRQLAADRLRPAALEADDTRTTPAELRAQVRELGVHHLSLPPAYDGFVEERSAVTGVLAAEALAHGDPGLTVSCLAPAAVATALALWGDADQQATYLPSFAGDEPPLAAFAVLEPRPLFDPFAPRTTARREGDRLVLDGVKSLVPAAAEAELFLVSVDLDGAPALVLVESGTDGVTVEDEPAMGLRAAATGRLHLADVRVPAGHVLAGGADGPGPAAVHAEAIHRARLGWCAVAVGTAQAVLDHVVPYVNERTAFGEPVSHRQSVAFAVADVAIELEGMRLTTYRAASLADRGAPFGRQAAVARALCADEGVRIGSQGVQLLGGHGFVKEHPVERWYRELRATGLAEGVLLV